MNRTDYLKFILEDQEGRDFLRSIILEKHKRYEEICVIKEEFLRFNRFHECDEFGRWFLERIFNSILEGRELSQIEKDLTSMCFYLNRSEGKLPKRTHWEDQYEKAKNQVRIGDVIQRYLRVDNFKRNIVCSFHEDRAPSLKVYEDSNYFVCFGCGARGSPIDFVMQIENCSFKEAISILSTF